MRVGGRVPSPEFLALSERWVRGEITIDEMIAEVHKLWGNRS